MKKIIVLFLVASIFAACQTRELETIPEVGQMMMAAAMLKSNSEPTDDDIDSEMWNICRCGTYPRIRAAIKTAAKEMQSK